MTALQRYWTQLSTHWQQALQFGGWGALGGGLGSLFTEIFRFNSRSALSFVTVVAQTGLWFGLIGASIAITLLVGYSWYFKRGFKLGQACRSGGLPGFVAGGGAGAIAQFTYGFIGPTELLRVICWGLAGGLLGLGLSVRIPNLNPWRGSLGGLVGGLLGGGLFIGFSLLLGNVAGRFFGITAIGFWIGLMIMLFEAAFRQAWLVVRWTPTESKTMTLGSEPITLGSSDHSHIYLRKDQGYPPTTASIFMENNKIVMEYDPQMQALRGMQVLRHELKPGDRRKLGDVILEVQTANLQPIRSNGKESSRREP